MNMPSSISSILDQMLSGGRDLARRGEDAAAERLGYGNAPDERGRMRNTMLASGAAAGVLGLMLGSKKGRKLAGNVAMLGGLGVLGKLAYDAYRDRGGTEPQAPNVAELSGPEAETRAIAITRAMIAASKADGHVDEAERAHIEEALGKLPAAVRGLVREEIDRPLDASSVARLADSPQAGREIYLASLLVTGDDTLAEREYLNSLAQALRLDPDTVAELRRDVSA